MSEKQFDRPRELGPGFSGGVASTDHSSALQYCFAEASAKSDPDELYFYYLVRLLLSPRLSSSL